jgi:nucleoid-associated protein YgaU
MGLSMKIKTDLRAGAACYTVKSGDNLSDIAYKFYGNKSAESVATIYYANQKTIGPNPNVIYPGQKLYIPS